jgi:hypothetical protein
MPGYGIKKAAKKVTKKLVKKGVYNAMQEDAVKKKKANKRYETIKKAMDNPRKKKSAPVKGMIGNKYK